MPTGNTNTMVCGMIAWPALINGQQWAYHFVVISRTLNTASFSRSIREADCPNARTTSMPFTYSTIVAFICMLLAR